MPSDRDIADGNGRKQVLFDDRGAVEAPTDTPLSIGNLAKMLHVSRLRLWLYECRGLIKRRRLGDDLVYDWEDCARVFFIIKARRVGLRVSHILPLIDATKPGASDATIRHARTRSLALIHRLNRRHQALRQALAEIRFLYRLLAEKQPGSESPAAADQCDDSDLP